MKLGLKGKKAIVTGGATGLGKQFVLTLSREGVQVAFTYYSEKEHPEETVSEVFKETGLKVYPIKTDLSQEEQVRGFFKQAVKELGQVDILVNNAGIWLTGKVDDIKVNDWDLTLKTNLRAPFILTQEFIRDANSKKHGGHIINITSQAAYYGSTTGHSHYAASKAGLIAFSASTAREQAKNGINVINLCIGIMHTRMIQSNLDKDPNYYVNRIPKGRVIEPEEVAKMGVLFSSDVYSYVTGATIDVTGGMLMH